MTWLELPGVVGGLLAFGLIGIFVGPVVLAVADVLLKAWIDGDLKRPKRLNRINPLGHPLEGSGQQARSLPIGVGFFYSLNFNSGGK